MTTALEILTAARELITDPAHWTQEVYAKNAKGRQVSPLSRSAVCFCSVGALDRIVSRRSKSDWGVEAFNALVNELVKKGHQGIAGFNDTHTHAEVLALFDAAIAAEREKAGAK